MAQVYDINIKINVDDSNLESVANALQELEGNAENTGETIQEQFNQATAEVERLEEALMEAELNGDDIQADIIADELAYAREEAENLEQALSDASSSAQDAGDSFSDAGDKAQESGEQMREMGDNARDSAQSTKDAADETASAMDNIGTVMGGLGSALALNTMLDTAGNIEDSWTRLELTFGQVTDGLRSSIDQASADTGRSGSSIRGYFNMMGIAGITNMDLLKNSFEAVSGKAFQTGADVNQLGGLMQKMTLSGNAGARQLTMLGISTDDLGRAMGVAGDEASKAFKNLSQEERLTALTKAMGDGSKANEEYKNSWQGVKDQVGIALGGLMGAIGSAIMPVIIPAINSAKDAINGLKDAFKNLPPDVQGVIGGLGAGILAFGALKGAITVIGPILGGLFGALTTGVSAVMAFVSAGSILEGATAAIGIIFGTTAASIFAVAWPIFAVIGAVALLVVGLEKLGEWMGWWKDWGGFVDSAKSAITRFWEAFINHPDVQAILGALGTAWDVLVDVVSGVVDWFSGVWNSLFPPEARAQIDAVSNVITGFGMIWDILTFPIHNAINVLQMVWEAFNTLYTSLQPVIAFLSSILVPIWNVLSTNIMLGVNSVNALINIFTAFLSGQLTLPEALSAVWSVISGLFTGVTSNIISLVSSFGTRIVGNIRTIAGNFVRGFINGLSNLKSAFSNALKGPLDAVSDWGRSILNKVGEIVDGLKKKFEEAKNYITSIGDFGFDMGFGDYGFNDVTVNSFRGTDYGFNSGNTVNNKFNEVASNQNQTINNYNTTLKGIIDKPASQYILDVLGHDARKKNLTKGV